MTARPAGQPLEPIVDDLAWCWWTRPRATVLDGVAYFGALDSAGHIVAATWDLAKRCAQRSILATVENDDHNNPALVVQAGRPLVAFYSRHDEDDAVRYRVADGDGISRWRPEQVLRFGGRTTYAQVHARGDELHLFTRVDDTAWSYRRSMDWAATWPEPTRFLAFDTDQELYMPTVMLADRRTLRVAVSGHPKEYQRKPLHDIWVCLVDLETGDVTRPSDGTRLGNLRSGAGMPLNYDRMEVAYRAPADRTVNLFDVGDGPAFEIGFVSKVKGDASTVDARYHVTARYEGGWRTEDLAPAGSTFGYIHAGFYVGGMAFPDRTPGGQVYLTREADGLWYLERWARDPGRWTPRRLLGPSTIRLTRPWAVANPAGGLEVVVLGLERYGAEYFDTLSHLIGAGADGPYLPSRSSQRPTVH